MPCAWADAGEHASQHTMKSEARNRTLTRSAFGRHVGRMSPPIDSHTRSPVTSATRGNTVTVGERLGFTGGSISASDVRWAGSKGTTMITSEEHLVCQPPCPRLRTAGENTFGYECEHMRHAPSSSPPLYQERCALPKVCDCEASH